jgi:hypothetical protein
MSRHSCLGMVFPSFKAILSIIYVHQGSVAPTVLLDVPIIYGIMPLIFRFSSLSMYAATLYSTRILGRQTLDSLSPARRHHHSRGKASRCLGQTR